MKNATCMSAHEQLMSAHEQLLAQIDLASIQMTSWLLATSKPRDIEEKIRAELVNLLQGDSGQCFGFLQGLLASETITKRCYENIIKDHQLLQDYALLAKAKKDYYEALANNFAVA